MLYLDKTLKFLSLLFGHIGTVAAFLAMFYGTLRGELLELWDKIQTIPEYEEERKLLKQGIADVLSTT